MEQYFTKSPTSEQIDFPFTALAAGSEFTFTGGSGVFSKRHLDPGTELLIGVLADTETGLNGSILDLGCGYGPIGIVLARLNPKAEILLVDINERAVELANRNIAANKAKNAVAAQSDGFEAAPGPFDLIVSNPPMRTGKQNVSALMRESFARLLPAGRFYAVIGKKQGAESYHKILCGIFGSCEVAHKKSGFYVFRATKC
jgi:16S rRNA (guanine1207-N2)-methyltransferase